MATAAAKSAPPPPKKRAVVGAICTTLRIYGHQQSNVASERLLSSAGNAVVKYDSKKQSTCTSAWKICILTSYVHNT